MQRKIKGQVQIIKYKGEEKVGKKIVYFQSGMKRKCEPEGPAAGSVGQDIEK